MPNCRSCHDSVNMTLVSYIRGFSRFTYFAKMGKSVTCLICVSHFLRFETFLMENDTGYSFCVFNYLRFKRSREKSENYMIYGIFTHICTFNITVI